MKRTSDIKIAVTLDEENVPDKITWKASETAANMDNEARAMLVSFWNSDQKTAFRIDLWTKDMMMDEMAEFIFQTLVGMSETYEHATQYSDHAKEMKQFAMDFLKKFKSRQADAPKMD